MGLLFSFSLLDRLPTTSTTLHPQYIEYSTSRTPLSKQCCDVTREKKITDCYHSYQVELDHVHHPSPPPLYSSTNSPPLSPSLSSSPLPLLCSVDQIEGDYKYKPGRGILQFCKDHTCTRDLLYCLLHGRPLAIVGYPSQEK